MSYGKLDIWLRFKDCSLIDSCWMTDLVIKTCGGKYFVDMDPDVLDQLRTRYPELRFAVQPDYLGEKRINIRPEEVGKHINHIEVDVPPGCYVVWTRVCYGDNEETNKIMAIVDCGKEVCVNLLLDEVKRCVNDVWYPFGIAAIALEVPDHDIRIAVMAEAKVAGIPDAEVIRELDRRYKELEAAKEPEAREYLEPTKHLMEIMRSPQEKV